MVLKSNDVQNGFTAKVHSISATLAAVALLSACATTGTEQTLHTPELAVKEAESELAKGQRDKAVAILSQSAQENPTSTVPWLKISNIWFDAANYPSAIQAANEALQRDAGSQEAKSLVVVSGLRIAANAVSGLRTSNSVNSSARYEAENLTNALRSALGEKNLVPASGGEAKPQTSTAARGKAARGRSSVTNSSGSTSSSSASQGGAVNPFKSLK